jgi:DNA-binding transcriptional regulator GbsR (MarR family)
MAESRRTPDSIVQVNKSMLDGLGQLAAYFGFPPVMGRLYGALLLSPEPLSLDDLAERLGISKGNVSMNTQALERLGAVREVWVRDDPQRKRRKFYEAEADLWKIVTSVLQSRERREVDVALQVLAENVQRLNADQDNLSPEDRKLAAFYLERIANVQALFRFAQTALELFMGQGNAIDFSAITKIKIE